MVLCACCLLCRLRVARRTGQASGLCVKLIVLFFHLSQLFLRSVTPDTLGGQTGLGWSRAETPPVVPVRGYLEGIRRLMQGDKQRGLKQSVFGTHKGLVHGPCTGCTQVRSYIGS